MSPAPVSALPSAAVAVGEVPCLMRASFTRLVEMHATPMISLLSVITLTM